MKDRCVPPERSAFLRLHRFIDGGYMHVLPPLAVNVWFVLYRHADVEGIGWPSIQRLCDLTGRCRSGVCKALKQLHDHGLWEAVKDREGGYASRRSTTRRLLIPPPLPNNVLRRGSLKASTKDMPASEAMVSRGNPNSNQVDRTVLPGRTHSEQTVLPGETPTEEMVLLDRTIPNVPPTESVPLSGTEGSCLTSPDGPPSHHGTVLSSGTRTDKEEISEQDSNSNAAAEASQPDQDAGEARRLLMAQGVTPDMATRLVLQKRPHALAAVQHAISRANAQENRGFRSARPGFVVELVRTYEPPATDCQLQKQSPEQAREEALAEQAKRQAERSSEEQAVEEQHQENWQRLAALPPERYQQLERLVKANCSFAKGDLRSSPILQALAVAELDRKEVQDELAA